MSPVTSNAPKTALSAATVRCWCHVDADVECDDETFLRRQAIVDDVFSRITVRPGLTVAHDFAVSVCETVPDRVTGDPTPMRWEDEALGEALTRLIASPTVPDEALPGAAAVAALRAVVNNDVHELCEFFTVDGARVFDPHPNGLRWDSPLVDVTLHHVDCEHVSTPAEFDDRGDWTPVSCDEADELLAEVTASVSFGPFGRWASERFNAYPGEVAHVALYPNRQTGKLEEFSWSAELSDRYTRSPGDGPEVLRDEMLRDLFRLAVESITHEALEWLLIDGARVFDPHPPLLAQRDWFVPKVTFAPASEWLR